MRFSVIVPVYNAASWLERCVNSVKTQSRTDWELILVDDGSSDNSWELMTRLAQEDARLHLLRQENLGQLRARRLGISRAAGEYLLFLDSDDEWEPGALERIDDALTALDPDLLLFTGKILTDGQDSGRRFGDLGAEGRLVSVQEIRKILISCNDLNSLCIKAFRRCLLEAEVPDTLSFGAGYGEDQIQLLEPLSRAKRIAYIPDALYRYDHRPESTMHSLRLEAAERLLGNERFDLLERYRNVWGLTDRKDRKNLALYYLRNYISVYYGLRKACRDKPQRLALRRYPWGTTLRRSYFTAVPGLSAGEQWKLLGALLRL